MREWVIVIALVNGMIGGLILVLPILALQGGTILSLLVILSTGFFSFYSCYLCIIHLGSCSDLDKAILQHFNQSKVMRIIYDLLVFMNLLFLLMLYFNLIVTQWKGLVHYDLANPLCNAAALFFLTFALNYFHFGAQLLGYGVISIIGYCIFLVWLIASAPQGPNTIPAFGSGAVNLAASMGQAFSIQAFFIPVLRQIPQSVNYVKYTLISYVVGGAVYLYIAYAGSFGILNRKTVPPDIIPSTIQDYFPQDQWQPAIVQVIYLVHLYSAYGEFLLICKKRFFNIFGIKQSKQGTILNIPQMIFVAILIGITVGIFFGKVGINILIQINGAILGFFFIYLLPAAMHFVCLYFPGKDKHVLVIKLQNDTVAPTNQTSLKYNYDINGTIIGQVEKIDSNDKRQRMIQLEQIQSHQQNTIPIQLSPDLTPDMKLDRSVSQPPLLSQPQSPIIQQAPATVTLSVTGPVQPRNNTDVSTFPLQQLQSNYANVHTLNQFSCTCKKPKPLLQVLDIISMVGMVGLGAFIMVDGFISVITGA